ncbi:protein kinase [Luteolibacter flavescens]|uniref:Protein kinase n=1 Tax=Luteolibacter flavescens TaxID=1859460 RepID=A0ABT3FKF0_9BACT|nr:serine/threonine-protein kinase [Luteolibacter flavescens]MCW1884038.1 protein kinase [Luteolibacter flavescens]
MTPESFDPPTLEALASLLPGYEFEAFIAQGGMGAVYKARQRSLDRDVAIKILPRELGEDPEFRQSFETEAKAMARLNHPNLIGVYDFGDADGMPYIVMEYVNGKSLFHSAHNLSVEPRQAVTIVKGICDGLAHAHEHGVIHRDIKPANILLTPKAVPKVGDFGLARPAGAGSTGLLMGTPGYSAPEIMREPDHADHRSDIFALGVVLYELLIGRCPPYDIPAPPPSSIVGCDTALDAICAIATHPTAGMRYPSAEAMSAALDNWLRGAASPPPAPKTTSTISRRPARPPRAAAGEPVPIVVKRRSGSSFVVQAGVLAVLIVATAIAWKKLRGMEDDKAAQQAAYDASKADQEADKSSPGTTSPGPAAPKDPIKPDPVTPDEDPLPQAGNDPAEPDLADMDDEPGTDAPDTGLPPEEPMDDEDGPDETATAQVELPPAILELEAKAKTLVAALDADRAKELAANAKTYAWDLDSWLKTLNKGDQTIWKTQVERMKRLVTDNRVPDEIGASSGIRLSERMSKIADFSSRKQQTIDESFETKAVKIRDAYVTRVSEAVEASQKSGEDDVAVALQARVEAAADLDGWLATLGVAEQEQQAAATSFKVVSATYGTGGKNADVTVKVREWLTVKKESFRVSPSDLGADPNPGWNKQLTITYVLDGEEGEKSWGENSKVDLEELIPHPDF